MKKSLLFVFVLFVLCLAVSVCAAADDAFRFQDVFTWGMTQDEVIENLPTRRYEMERERKLAYLEVDDDRYEFEKIPAEVTFGFRDNALAVIRLSFDTEDRGVSEKAVMDAMEKLYGKAEEVTDLKVVDDLTADVDADEIDMDVRRGDTVMQWTLDDGTNILIRIEGHDDEITAAFFSN